MTSVLSEGQVYLQSYLAPFADILGRADVTDIYVNAPEECWAETLGGGVERHRIAGLDGTALTRLARQIAAYAHQGINREHPILSATLPSGERVQIVIPPATRGDIVLAIRKHVSPNLSLEDYVVSGAFASAHLGGSRHEIGLDAELSERLQAGDVAGLLGAAVRGRRNILISGGTSTGKTTFLNALIREVPHEERLIFIEDTPELHLHHPNAIGLIAPRSALGEALVTAEDLLNASLRMRPDRIILGELRGLEAYQAVEEVRSAAGLGMIHSLLGRLEGRRMRGSDRRAGSLFSYVDLEARVRSDHPLRAIRRLVEAALDALSEDFSELYSGMGRPSIPPEMLLRSMLLQAFYSIRSERQLMERLEFDLLFRWFVGLGVDDPAWDHSTFSKNRDRLLEGEIAARFLAAVLAQPRVKRLLSTDHFSVDGTLIEAWASMKSFKPKASGGDDAPPPASGGRNAEVDFKGQTRSNQTHESTTDPEARLYRKGAGMEARLCFIGHTLMENRSGLIVDACLTPADGHAERIAALAMIEPRADRPRAISLGADKAYDTRDFVNELRSMNVRPHVAQNTNGRRSAIDGRTTRHAGYAMSQTIRKRIEEGFGWIKTIAGQRKTRFRGRDRVGWAFTFAAAAYNLVRLPKLLEASA